MTTGSNVLDDVAKVIGLDATMLLVRHFGGLELAVPAKVGPHHPIVVAIGAVAAARLVEHYHGSKIMIARTGERHQRVRALAASGRLTRAAIAREVGYTERRIYQLLESEPGEEQLDLFGS